MNTLAKKVASCYGNHRSILNAFMLVYLNRMKIKRHLKFALEQRHFLNVKEKKKTERKLQYLVITLI